MAISQKASFQKIFIGALLASALAVGLYIGLSRTSKTDSIFPYDSAIDRSYIINLFKKDWYWLISDYSKNYSAEHMLDTKSPSETSDHAGELIIKTYRQDGKPAGFIAYYIKEFLEGYILFLGVGEEYRKHGIARKLTQYALDDFKKRGMRVARLLTRADNVRSRALYESFGFKQFWTDGAYVRYEMYLDK